MKDNEIQVVVVRYPDRRHFMMRYVDPVTGKQKARSTGTTVHRDAERAAARWEQELQQGTYRPKRNITWAEFRERYELEKLASLAESTQRAASTALNHLERILDPLKLSAVNSENLSKFQAALRQEKKPDTTIGAILSHLRPALSWAVSMGLLSHVPQIHRPVAAKGRRLMRGRPITGEEFDRMIHVVPKIRKHDSALWTRYLTGLWLSGLRLEESTILSWDDDASFAVDVSGRRPRFRIYAEAEKGRQDRYLPMTPDFAQFIQATPKEAREGAVFKLVSKSTGQTLSLKRISRTVSAIGEKANVVVNKVTGKFASAHDLRRSFGTRWASRVKPATLQLLMRHESIETTLKYYVDQDADDVADELWKAFGDSGNSFGNSRPKSQGSDPDRPTDDPTQAPVES
jgi:integrase